MIDPEQSSSLQSRRKCLVVLAGGADTSDRPARALAQHLTELGFESKYLGRERSARRIARAVGHERADTVELCMAGGGVVLLRELLRELQRAGRREVSIVPHRII